MDSGRYPSSGSDGNERRLFEPGAERRAGSPGRTLRHSPDIEVAVFSWPHLHAKVAVGTAVTRCPPHSPVLAQLAHTVPTLDVWRRSAHEDRDVRGRQREYG